MTRPLRDTFVEDEEAGGEALAGEETVNKHEICDIFGTAVVNGFNYFVIHFAALLFLSVSTVLTCF